MAWNSTIIKNTLLTPDLLQIQIEKPTSFGFVAGQFVRFYIPQGEKKLFRSYSIASSPLDTTLSFFIRLYTDGVGSQHISKLPKNSTLEWDGPFGLFVNKSDRPLFFVATGAGLAPCFSILKNELVEKSNRADLRLLLGLRYEADLYMISELEDWQKKYPNFRYQIILSRSSESWTGLRGHVTEYLPNNPKNFDFFLCGNPEMIKEARTILRHCGLAPTQIHQEIF